MEWVGRLILFKYLLPTAMLFVLLYAIVVALGLGNTLKSLMLTYLSFTVPFCTWMLMGYFRSIPPELEEHAMVDGCTKIGALFRILFPLSAQVSSPPRSSRSPWPGTSSSSPSSSPVTIGR